METLEEMETELVNVCAQLLKMTLTAAQARALHDGSPKVAEYAGRLSEARLVIYARGHDLEIELLGPAADGGGTVRFFKLDANSAPAWTLN